MTTWRERLAPHVRVAIAACRAEHGDDARELRKALRDAYPGYTRAGWVYAVWRDEVARQLGTLRGRLLARKSPLRAARAAEAAGQMRLFGAVDVADLLEVLRVVKDLRDASPVDERHVEETG